MHLLILAAIPFCVKIATLAIVATGYVLQSVYKLFQLGIPLWWRWKDGKTLWPEHTLPSIRHCLLAISLGLMLSIAAIGLLQYVLSIWVIDVHQLRESFDDRFAVSPLGAVMVVVFLSVINAGLEEYHFRAWLDIELSKQYGRTFGIIVSAFAFGSMHSLIFMGMPHISYGLIATIVIGLMIPAIAWSYLLRLPGGWYAVWLSHGVADMVLLGWGLHWLEYI